MKNTLNKNMFKYVDWFLIILVCVIVGYSLLSLTNATANPFTGNEVTFSDIMANLNLGDVLKQLMFFGIGLGFIFVIALMDYNSLRSYTEYIYWACIALLVVLLIPGVGSTQNGTTGWFTIAGYNLQPSEFTKVGLILVFARIIANQTEGNDSGITKFSQVWPLFWRFLIPFILVATQPDMGTALVYCAIFIGILFMAKTSLKIFGILFGIAGGAAPLVWLTLQPYQKDRLFSFLNLNSDATSQAISDQKYHITQAQLAMSSGQMFGKGLFASGSMSQLGYVPEARNDFIFSVTAEAFGFIGAMILLTLLALLIVRLCMLSMRAKDDFGTYIIIGLVAMLLFHILENVGMNLGILPITGISLPLFSYGGSNLLTVMIAIGFVISVDMRRQRWNV